MPLLNSKSLKGKTSTRSETETDKKTQRGPRSCDRRQDYSDSEDEGYTSVSGSGHFNASTPISRRRPATPPSTSPRREISRDHDQRARSRNPSARNLLVSPPTTPRVKSSKDWLVPVTPPGASDSEGEKEDAPATHRPRLPSLVHFLPSPPITPPDEAESYDESLARYGTNPRLPAPQFVPRQSSGALSRSLCSGLTRQIRPCKNPVKVAGGRCHHHRNQVLGSLATHPTETQVSGSLDKTKYGATTQKGHPCKNPGRPVYGGGYHHDPRTSETLSRISDPVEPRPAGNTVQSLGITQKGTACLRKKKHGPDGRCCHDHQDQRPSENLTARSEEKTLRSNNNHIRDVLVTRQAEHQGRRARNLPQRRPSCRDPPTQRESTPQRPLRLSDWIPGYLQPKTQADLDKVMTNGVNIDKDGHIYAFELKDPRRRRKNSIPELQDFLVKVGRSIDGSKRVRWWANHFCSQELVPLGYWPGTSQGNRKQSRRDSVHSNEEIVEPGRRGKYCHLREKLILLELKDVACNSVHLTHFWRDSTATLRNGRSASGYPPSSRPIPMACTEETCPTKHRELFRLKRFESPEMRGKEWEYVVLPIIEKWERFVEEFGDRISQA